MQRGAVLTREEEADLERQASDGERARRKLEVVAELFDELEATISARFLRLSAKEVADDPIALHRLKSAQLGVAAARSILTARIETGRLAMEQLTDARENRLGRDAER